MKSIEMRAWKNRKCIFEVIKKMLIEAFFSTTIFQVNSNVFLLPHTADIKNKNKVSWHNCSDENIRLKPYCF